MNIIVRLARVTSTALLLGALAVSPAEAQEHKGGYGGSYGPLLRLLPGSEHSLGDGIRQVTDPPETPISAKFELKDGRLMLSVYIAGKGLKADAEHNVLKEYIGDPTGERWEPEVEVFGDVAHVARSAQQQTLMASSPFGLLDIMERAGQDQAGTVFSVIPVSTGGRQQFVVLVASQGRVVELRYGVLSGVLEGRAATWTFEADEEGGGAMGFETVEGAWEVGAGGPRGRVLAQRAASGGSVFNVALVTGSTHRDVDLSVAMRAVEGRIDQGGGLVWRALDGRNYYIARYNPLEDNYRVYKVVDGRRMQLQSADIPHEKGWHTLRVTMHGQQIRCFYDGKESLSVRDGTFTDAGRIGLWTKADARTEFDDLHAAGMPERALDAGEIGAAAGTEATLKPDGVVRVGWLRTDVAVRIDGMEFPPPAGLGSWAAFRSTPGGAMVMGDTVVFQDEVDAAMDAAFAAGLEVTALHNHFFFDEPKVYFMHIGGRGDPVELAGGVRMVWDAIRRVRAERPEPAAGFSGAAPENGSLATGSIREILGRAGTMKDGVYKVSIPRTGSMHGVRVGGSMGLASWAAFSGSDAHAAVDGDFIMTGNEVQPVLRALRDAGIHVVALHNHMIGEEPPFYFTHFWGKGAAAELARGIKAALDAQDESDNGEGSVGWGETGTIRRYRFEEAFWGIEGDNGRRYAFERELPEAMQKDGVRVRFEATARMGAHGAVRFGSTTSGWWVSVKLERIEALR